MCQKHEEEENDNVTESSWVVLLFKLKSQSHISSQIPVVLTDNCESFHGICPSSRHVMGYFRLGSIHSEVKDTKLLICSGQKKYFHSVV